MYVLFFLFLFFFFNDTATTEIYTLSLHDALPISPAPARPQWRPSARSWCRRCGAPATRRDRKSTRLNSSHTVISYAVFCFNKKKNQALHPARDTQKKTNLYTSLDNHHQ